ncbi:MAG TPA: helix-hairpin-helix domain-containing protein [Candidatus Dormibacteraeota bacterium]|nr:helix-hairpin-helix domain-containing protein [Candidatus Dormibacteraeota bacterium]
MRSSALSLLASLAARLSLGPRHLVLLVAVAPPVVTVALVVAVLVYASPSASTSLSGAPGPAAAADAGGGAGADGEGTAGLPPPGGLLVQVSGAVTRPGLYRVAKGDRVSAAIAAAGGITAAADPSRLPDLAQVLKDGQEVKVPRLGTPVRSGTSASTARISPVDLNAATQDELAAIPGFTQELAAAAVRYRTEYGGFSSTRELVDVLNMSEADYLVARKYLRV